ncbi:MAG: hypothetical protein FWC54_00535 [Actinomycetia bacterium]|nr:hypothetical protein [Actinomycetes bacterium]
MNRQESRQNNIAVCNLQASGAGLSRVLSNIDEYDICIITAYRHALSHNENQARNQELGSTLNSLGYGFIQVDGYYKEIGDDEPQPEAAFFVMNTRGTFEAFQDEMLSLGYQYDQDSILLKEKDGDPQYINKYGGADKSFSGLHSMGDVEAVVRELFKSGEETVGWSEIGNHGFRFASAGNVQGSPPQNFLEYIALDGRREKIFGVG